MRSQQLQGLEPQQVKLLEHVGSWQIYFYRGQGWSNAQSTGDVAPPQPLAAAPPTAAASAVQRQQLPTGVRLVIELPEGKLTRDVLLEAAS